MKKDYDFFVSRRNTPNLKLYTRLIGLFYAFSGLNAILCVICQRVDEKLVFSVVIIGIMLFLMVPTATKDPRRKSRNFGAVIATGLVHLEITIFLIIAFQFMLLAVIYVVEWVICIACIIYFRRNPKA